MSRGNDLSGHCYREDAMLSTLFYILAIWTGMSLSIGIVWVTLCFAYDGFEAFAFAARQTLP